MAVTLIILIFIFGLCVGSFINALEYRISTKKTIGGRSMCPECKHKLVWYDLIPLFSFLQLGGKCRYCSKGISIQYPLVELLTGITFAGVWYTSPFREAFQRYLINPELGNSPSVIPLLVLLLTLVIFSILLLVGLHDAKTGYILSTYVYVAAALSVVIIFVNYHGAVNFVDMAKYFMPYFYSAILPAAIFFSFFFFSHGKWMGAGDSEIAILMGLFLGFPSVLVAYYTAFIVGSCWSLVQVYVTKKAKMKTAIPLGPFLVLGVYAGYLFGPQLIELYAKIFLGA